MALYRYLIFIKKTLYIEVITILKGFPHSRRGTQVWCGCIKCTVCFQRSIWDGKIAPAGTRNRNNEYARVFRFSGDGQTTVYLAITPLTPTKSLQLFLKLRSFSKAIRTVPKTRIFKYVYKSVGISFFKLNSDIHIKSWARCTHTRGSGIAVWRITRRNKEFTVIFSHWKVNTMYTPPSPSVRRYSCFIYTSTRA